MKAKNLAVLALAVVITALTTHQLWPVKVQVPPLASQTQAPQLPQPAQASSAPPVGVPVPPHSQPPVFLPPEMAAQFEKARQTVFAAHPELKTEEVSLNKQRQALSKENSSASANARMTFIAKWQAHAQKMRDAIGMANPSLQTAFADFNAKVTARQQQLAQQQAQSVPASSDLTPTPSSNSPGQSPTPIH